MDQWLLTFDDANLEKRYREGVLLSIRAVDMQWISIVVRIVALVRLRAVMRGNGLEFTLGEYGQCVLMLALPLIERKGRKYVPMGWFLRHWMKVQFVLGLIQVTLLASFSRIHSRIEYSGGKTSPIYTLAFSGFFVHLFLMLRHRTGLHLYLISSSYASMVWHATAMSQFCERLMNSSKMLVPKIMDSMLRDRVFVPNQGGAGDLPDAILCRRTFTFLQLFVGMVCMTYGAWRLERRSRMKFIAALDEAEVQPETTPPRVQKLGDAFQQISGFGMLLVLSWRVAAIAHPL
ncbi:hypothetical protein BSKO_12215 [Bryopsis sp. KO-2023]|nr:hypothetical protein BSKO_12215 [Bryopsis sp. KO-2023]